MHWSLGTKYVFVIYRPIRFGSLFTNSLGKCFSSLYIVQYGSSFSNQSGSFPTSLLRSGRDEFVNEDVQTVTAHSPKFMTRTFSELRVKTLWQGNGTLNHKRSLPDRKVPVFSFTIETDSVDPNNIVVSWPMKFPPPVIANPTVRKTINAKADSSISTRHKHRDPSGNTWCTLHPAMNLYLFRIPILT